MSTGPIVIIPHIFQPAAWQPVLEFTPWYKLALLLGLAGLPFLAFRFGALDGKGTVAALLLGLWIAFLGGLGWLALLIAFSAIGFVVTRIARDDKVRLHVAEDNNGTRGLSNVLANGGAAGLAAFAIILVDAQAAALAFATAIAAVTADTMASEVGVLSRKARSILPPFRGSERGRNGAVSLLGQVGAAAGATAIAVLSMPLLQIPSDLVWVPAVAGFVGCQLDSLLGATLERDHIRDGPLSKADVNFIASAVPALVVLVVALV